jgi:hypothetical protein
VIHSFSSEQKIPLDPKEEESIEARRNSLSEARNNSRPENENKKDNLSHLGLCNFE